MRAGRGDAALEAPRLVGSARNAAKEHRIARENGSAPCGKVAFGSSVNQYRERATDRLIRELLTEVPALVIVGPRATGKTTTASRHAATTGGGRF